MHKSIHFLTIFIHIIISTTNIFASQTAITEIKLTRILQKEKNQSIIISDFEKNSCLTLTKENYYNTIHCYGYPFLDRMIQIPIKNKLAILFPEMIREIRSNFLPSLSFVDTQSDENIKILPEYTLLNTSLGFQLHKNINTTKNISSMPPYVDIDIDGPQLKEIQQRLNQNKSCTISTQNFDGNSINVKITEITDKQIISQFVIEKNNEPCNSQLETCIVKLLSGRYKLYIYTKNKSDEIYSYGERSCDINLSQEHINTLEQNYDNKGIAKNPNHPCILTLKNPSGQHTNFNITKIANFKSATSESKTFLKNRAIKYVVYSIVALIITIPSLIYLMKIFLHTA